MGHTRSTCWKLHGKPTNWEPRSKGKGGPKQHKKHGPSYAAIGPSNLQARSNAVQAASSGLKPSKISELSTAQFKKLLDIVGRDNHSAEPLVGPHHEEDVWSG
ncbi:hypothetical protein CRG98_047640 [Punica granatum]|uniref:Uncharacterized protein n=1 Tax=Punica granatum TaxID=22663 RepID=A0A2I0HJS9_PUNGR|nr:hypothetical protein CRG98_047640 [Punica granatum]